MPLVAPFFSMNEVRKPFANRVYHDNSDCPAGRDIPHDDRMRGTGPYRPCEDCKRMDQPPTQ